MSDRAAEPDEAKPEDHEADAPDPSTGAETGPAAAAGDGPDSSPDSVGPAGAPDDSADASTGTETGPDTADDEAESSTDSEADDGLADGGADASTGAAIGEAPPASDVSDSSSPSAAGVVAPAADATDATAGTAAAEPTGVAAAVEPPSPDVALADEASPLPGVHRGGFQRLPTAPLAVTTETAPAEPGTADAQEPIANWLVPESAAPRRGLAGWALAFSIAGLVVSQFVGWGFPIGLVGVVSAILALRRPLESRAVAVWALVLGSVSVLYSAGWLLYAASRANLFG